MQICFDVTYCICSHVHQQQCSNNECNPLLIAQGTRSPFLHLENLEIGDYAFTLKVTDTAGQTSQADVHVFVKPGKTVGIMVGTNTRIDVCVFVNQEHVSHI